MNISEIKEGVEIMDLIKKKIKVVKSYFESLNGKNKWRKKQKELESSGKLQGDTIIRISFSYLFRIIVDGKYFLVLNKRSKKYQPVGGVYKFYKEEGEYLSSEFCVENDDCIPVDKTTEMDYRLLVKNKYLRKFVKRFDETRSRENISNLSREFEEELFATNLLNKEEFGELTYLYCGRHMADIIKTKFFNKYELLFADIVSVSLTEKQKEMFRELMEKESEDYIFATAEEIMREGVNVNTGDHRETITNHTFKILSERTDELVKISDYERRYTVKFD